MNSMDYGGQCLPFAVKGCSSEIVSFVLGTIFLDGLWLNLVKFTFLFSEVHCCKKIENVAATYTFR